MQHLIDFEIYQFEKELLFQLHKNFEDTSSFLNWLKSLKNLSKEKIQSIILNVLKTNKILLPSVISIILTASPVFQLNDIISTFNDKDKKEILDEITKVDEFNFDEEKFLKKLSHRESSNDWTVVNQHGYVGKYQIGYIAMLDIADDLSLKYFNQLKGSKKEKIKKLLKANKFLEKNNLKQINQIKKLKIDEALKQTKISKILENAKNIKSDNIKKLENIFSEKEQDETIRKIMKSNEYLRRYKRYNNKVIDSVNITWPGMLAAAHLKGAKSVKQFLESNGKINPKDGNGASVKFYLSHFENLD